MAVFPEYSFCNVFSGLATTAKLLGCTADQLVTAMSTRKIRAGNDSIIKNLTLTQVRNYLENLCL
jgi:myosin heavy subunit